MGLSVAQSLLLEAAQVAGSAGYFRWESVGTSLGYTRAESDRAIRSLDERKLVVLLLEGSARVLDAGRQLAVQLEKKHGVRGRRST